MVMMIIITALLAIFYLAFYIHDAVLIEAVLKETAEQARFLGEGCSAEALEREAVKKAVPRLCIGGLRFFIGWEQEAVKARAEGSLCFPPWLPGRYAKRAWEYREQQDSMRPQDYIRKDRGRRTWNPGIKGN